MHVVREVREEVAGPALVPKLRQDAHLRLALITAGLAAALTCSDHVIMLPVPSVPCGSQARTRCPVADPRTRGKRGTI